MSSSFAVRDLASYGVKLRVPTRTEYVEFVDDFWRRIAARPAGSPPEDEDVLEFLNRHDGSGTALLSNERNVAILSIAYIWYVRGRDGEVGPSSSLPGTNASALLPFDWRPEYRPYRSYWKTIFPGSRRLLVCGGGWFGDNTDVRWPEATELFVSQGYVSGGGAPERLLAPVELCLDGVFFADGGYAGPNRLATWEHTNMAQQAYRECGRNRTLRARERFG